MARLHDQPLECFNPLDDRVCQLAILEQLEKKSLEAARASNAVNILLRFPVAGGYAIYLVVDDSPLTLQHVPYGKAYKASPNTIRKVTLTEVLKEAKSQLAFYAIEKSFKRTVNGMRAYNIRLM